MTEQLIEVDARLLQEVADRALIQDLIARYAFFGDYGPNESFADLFTPDGTWVIAGTDVVVRGRDQLVQLVTAVRDNAPGAHHMQSNHVVDLDGDRATGKVELNVFLLRPEEIYSNTHGWYEDVYVKVDGRWLIESRTIHLSADSMQVASTGKIGEHTAPMFAELGRLFGGEGHA
ncbi:nuclear transport factor 2 family protein [Rhodococcus sp. IEGM 1307]|jgi:uncharacterized protein (TIGR02246 family)|uniref:nuclear transport factor 2 family protein n=1 Tax=Rhodococcus sp. IEGM 1307 TaxID=3047091 RepID=UPI0024B7A3B6|nr:nuclear transport factor 2 family protein [Rhodococcus sp. IEGM 1307]MDI9979519.1 nuclear transport factor 2 family protein [Rhodococcus sp. IEGM 1307]